MCAPSGDWRGHTIAGCTLGLHQRKGNKIWGNNLGTNRAIKESKIPCPSCRDDGLLNMQISHKIKTNVRWCTHVCAMLENVRKQCCQLCAIETLDSNEYYVNCSNLSPELATLVVTYNNLFYCKWQRAPKEKFFFQLRTCSTSRNGT